MTSSLDQSLVLEAKALTALAFRNGPIEELHAGRVCSACHGDSAISHITDEEMKRLMKAAVNAMYRLLWERQHDPEAYSTSLQLGERYTRHWDDPEILAPIAR